jgi:hypothetical protein
MSAQLAVSVLPERVSSGVPIEDIAHLVGHASTNVTEKVYRKELRPVLSGEHQIVVHPLLPHLRAAVCEVSSRL